MIKITREEPVEPLVTITTTEYGAEFIAYCLRHYVSTAAVLTANSAAATLGLAAERAAKAISTKNFKFDWEKIPKLFT